MNDPSQSRTAEFVHLVKWTFAKTYVETAPHKYIVRDHLTDADKVLFDEFAALIEREGVRAKIL